MRRVLPAAALAALSLATAAARADDFVTVRGAYYREASTRVIQPTVEVERDSPTGLDVKAHFLVDAITSASIAAGTTVDTIFTETRNEVGLSFRYHDRGGEITGGYKYSAESDYWSHSVGGSVAGRFWGDTARLGISLGHSWDTLAWGSRTPCKTPPDISCPLDSTFAGISYTQILSPVLLAQLSTEASLLEGFQGNLYRSVPNFGYEKLPNLRMRTAVAARVANHWPGSGTTLRLQYRYYVDYQPDDQPDGDPWKIQSHMFEARLYQPLTDTLTVRLSYRQYLQSRAQLWCDPVAHPGCYPQSAVYYSTDPKLGPVRTEYPEIQLVWLASALRHVPVLRWLAAGTFQISYGRYVQNTTYGNAHLLQTGYTFPY